MSITMKFRMGTVESKRPKKAYRCPVPRVARMLALAHYIEQAVEDGALKDYAEASRLFGLSRARITQVMNLILLSPTIQAQILTGTPPLLERWLRPVLSTFVWSEQESILKNIGDN